MSINLQDFEQFQDKDSERELRIINNCLDYANGIPGGLPGHQLMLIVAKLHRMLWNPSKKYTAEAIKNHLYAYNLEFDNEQKTLDLHDFIKWLEGKDGTAS